MIHKLVRDRWKTMSKMGVQRTLQRVAQSCLHTSFVTVQTVICFNFYFDQQCAIYIYIYMYICRVFNNIYITIAPTCIETFLSFSGSSKVVG